MSRMWRWMEDHSVTNLSSKQFGFRKGHSTTDALLSVKGLVQETTARGEKIIGVNLND